MSLKSIDLSTPEAGLGCRSPKTPKPPKQPQSRQVYDHCIGSVTAKYYSTERKISQSKWPLLDGLLQGADKVAAVEGCASGSHQHTSAHQLDSHLPKRIIGDQVDQSRRRCDPKDGQGVQQGGGTPAWGAFTFRTPPGYIKWLIY